MSAPESSQQGPATREEHNAVQGRWDGAEPGQAEAMPATTTATPMDNPAPAEEPSGLPLGRVSESSKGAPDLGRPGRGTTELHGRQARQAPPAPAPAGTDALLTIAGAMRCVWEPRNKRHPHERSCATDGCCLDHAQAVLTALEAGGWFLAPPSRTEGVQRPEPLLGRAQDRDGWAEPGSRATTQAARDTVARLVCVPTQDGGMMLDWQAGGMEITIEVRPNGEIDTFTANTSHLFTRPLDPSAVEVLAEAIGSSMPLRMSPRGIAEVALKALTERHTGTGLNRPLGETHG